MAAVPQTDSIHIFWRFECTRSVHQSKTTKLGHKTNPLLLGPQLLYFATRAEDRTFCPGYFFTQCDCIEGTALQETKPLSQVTRQASSQCPAIHILTTDIQNTNCPCGCQPHQADFIAFSFPETPTGNGLAFADETSCPPLRQNCAGSAKTRRTRTFFIGVYFNSYPGCQKAE
jgi:hypothetical protein